MVKAISKISPPRIVLVSQYRPPLASICLELPAGLIDKGETAEIAAFRELFEETGLTSHRLISLSPVCCSDPGMTNTNMQLAVVEVDLDLPENRNAEQKLDDGECIDVEFAPWDDLLAWLMRRKIEMGWEIDARLMSFAVGLDLGVQSGNYTSSESSLNQGGDGAQTRKLDSQNLLDRRTGVATAGCGASISSLTEKNVAINDSPSPSHSCTTTNNKSTSYPQGNLRSDSVQTDVLPAMSHLRIQAASQAHAENLKEFHAAAENESSTSVSISTMETGEGHV